MPDFIRSRLFIGVAAGVVGISLGAASATEKTAEPASSSVPTSIVTQEVVVTKEVVDEACVEAISLARQGFSYSSDFAGIMSDFVGAAAEFDVDAMEVHTARLGPLSGKVSALAPRFNSAADDCEDAG